MRQPSTISCIGFAGLATAWLACSSVPAPTGWETDFSPTQAGPAATGGATVPEDPSTGKTDAGGDPVGDAGDAPDPTDPIYTTPVQCSSKTHWTQGNQGSTLMQPGSACRTCHVVGGSASKKSLDVAGTVYATAHEPTDCNGVSVSGATVVITDAKGATTSLTVNAAGNFSHNDTFGFAQIPKPYKAKIVYGGKQRVMVGAITDGDCNKCHTESGTSLAPGRIMLP